MEMAQARLEYYDLIINKLIVVKPKFNNIIYIEIISSENAYKLIENMKRFFGDYRRFSSRNLKGKSRIGQLNIWGNPISIRTFRETLVERWAFYVQYRLDYSETNGLILFFRDETDIELFKDFWESQERDVPLYLDSDEFNS